MDRLARNDLALDGHLVFLDDESDDDDADDAK